MGYCVIHSHQYANKIYKIPLLYLEFNYIIKRYTKRNEIKSTFDEINSSWYGWIEETEWGCAAWENI